MTLDKMVREYEKEGNTDHPRYKLYCDLLETASGKLQGLNDVFELEK